MTLEHLLSLPYKLSEDDKDNLILALLDQVAQLTNAQQHPQGNDSEECSSMCSNCKALRDKSGSKLIIKKYIEQKMNVSNSHGAGHCGKTDVF